jgi:cytochrome c oxidase subunit 4
MNRRPSSLLLVGVFVALLALLVATVVVWSLDLGNVGTALGLGIAVAKAALILLYFMHLRYETGLVRLVGGAALLWLGICFVLTFADYGTRGWQEPDAGSLAEATDRRDVDRTDPTFEEERPRR